VDGKPIAARRRSSIDRALDWAARHRRLVGAGFGALALVAMASVGIAAVIWHERNEKSLALEHARLQSQRAEAHFVDALEGTTRLLTKLEQPQWSNLPGIAELRNEGLTFFRQFVHAESGDPKIRFESARACRRMASVYCAEQDAAHAQEALQSEFTLLDRLVAEAPDEPAYREELASAHHLAGALYFSLQNSEAARAEFRQAGEQLSALAERFPTAERLNRYAWFLADCPEETLRDSAQSETLALRAIKIDAANGNYWNTLGVAQFRAGNFELAKQSLQKSMDLRAGGDPYDWFFLAMIAAEAGDARDAARWIDRSSAWISAHQPLSQDVLRYRAEARQFLGDKKFSSNP
jgi:tetratricopeptide (TPR) repeat protein